MAGLILFAPTILTAVIQLHGSYLDRGRAVVADRTPIGLLSIGRHFWRRLLSAVAASCVEHVALRPRERLERLVKALAGFGCAAAALVDGRHFGAFADGALEFFDREGGELFVG